ncbi:MAG TPA: glycosyltransferase [Methylomirabilota bacterium]|nr:glycosyltransferase [Methylomirabilota bacterium]
MTALSIYHLVAGAGLAALSLHTLLNHLTLRRLDRMRSSAPPPRMSVLIPARNEAARIRASVTGWVGQDYPTFEVIVYDDDSADDTAARALAAAAGRSRLRVVRGGPLPPGWAGKPWACHRLRAEAVGEVLVFADADIVPAPDVLGRTADALALLGADALSAVPAHESPHVGVRLLAGLQNWGALVFVPSWLDTGQGRVRCAALNGQFLAIRSTVYDASGGFSVARDSLAEDVHLGRHLAAGGYRVRLLDGARLLRCRPYATVRDLWGANARNLLAVFFDSPAVLLLALAALAALFVGPPVILGLGAALGRTGALWRWMPLAEIAAAVLLRLASDLRAGYPPWLALGQPLAILALIAMSLDSLLRLRVWRVVEWRGRRYDVAA